MTLTGRTEATSDIQAESQSLLRAPAGLYRYIFKGDQITINEMTASGGTVQLTTGTNQRNTSTGTAAQTNTNSYGVFTIAEVTLDEKNGARVATTIRLTEKVALGSTGAKIAGFNFTKAYVASIRRRNVMHSIDDISSADHLFKATGTNSGSGSAQIRAWARPRVYNLYQGAPYATSYDNLNDTIRTMSNGLGGYMLNVNGDDELTTKMCAHMTNEIIGAGAAPDTILSSQSTVLGFGERLKGDASAGTSRFRATYEAAGNQRPASMMPGLVPDGVLPGVDMTSPELNMSIVNTGISGINGANMFADTRIPPRYTAELASSPASTSTTATDAVTFNVQAAPVYFLTTRGLDGQPNLGLQVFLKGRYYENSNIVLNDQPATDGALLSMIELVARRLNVMGQINGISASNNLTEDNWDTAEGYTE